MLCGDPSVAVLVGLLYNTLLAWWWLDPLAALFIADIVVREGIESWRGNACCDSC
jgi:divalent metal cation (Fe/Co/Zn/Cd) transporter